MLFLVAAGHSFRKEIFQVKSRAGHSPRIKLFQEKVGQVAPTRCRPTPIQLVGYKL